VILKCLEKDPDERFQDVAELAIALYPFGPRRARVSAERCHHVLNGQKGAALEFSSVAPPPLGGNTPLPVSSTSAVVSAVPASQTAPEAFTTSNPAAVSVTASTPPQTGRRLVAVGALALVFAAMAVLGYTTFGVRNLPTPGAAAVGARAPELSPASPVAAPELAPVPLETMPSSASASPDDGAPIDVVDKRVAKRGKPSTKRNSKAQAVSKPGAAAAVTAPPAKRRTTVGDSEPDVGY
jgi:hypothetical protein